MKKGSLVSACLVASVAFTHVLNVAEAQSRCYLKHIQHSKPVEGECVADGGDNATNEEGVCTGDLSYIEIPASCRLLLLENAVLGIDEFKHLTEALPIASANLTELILDQGFEDAPTAEDFAAFGAAVSKIPNLQTLSFASNVNIANSLPSMFSTLSSETLRSLDLSACALTDDSGAILAEALSGFPQLEELRLNRNEFTDASAITIANALKKAKKQTLNKFFVGQNQFGGKAIDAIAELIEVEGSLLEFLDVRGYKNTYSDKSLDRLAAAVSASQKLSTIFVDMKDVDDILYNNALFHLDALVMHNKLKSSDTENEKENSGVCKFKDVVKCENGACEMYISEHCRFISLPRTRLSYTGSKLLSKALAREGVTAEGLDISDTSIGDFGVEGLTSIFENTGTLKSIMLRSNQLTEVGMRSISNAILEGIKKETFHLVNLDLMGNTASDGGARAMGKVLAKDPPSLNVLILDNNRISPTGLSTISRQLKKNTHLRILSLEGAQFDVDATDALAEAMSINTNLRHLYYSTNIWTFSSVYATDAVYRNLAAFEGLSTKYKPFVLPDDNMKCNAEEMVLCSFKGCKYRIPKQCSHVQLPSAGITPEEMKSLAKKLATNDKVIYLDLSHNILDDDGAKYLASALESNKQVQYLSLNKCSIGDNGLKEIARALEESQIHFLHLESNAFGAEGYAALFKTLKMNPNIVNVDLNLNVLDDAAAESIQATLSEIEGTGRLHSLTLDSHDLSEKGLESLFASLSAHFQIGHLSISMFSKTTVGKEMELSYGQAIANFIKNDNSLRSLKATGYSFSNDDKKYLLESIGESKTLSELFVDWPFRIQIDEVETIEKSDTLCSFRLPALTGKSKLSDFESESLMEIQLALAKNC